MKFLSVFEIPRWVACDPHHILVSCLFNNKTVFLSLPLSWRGFRDCKDTLFLIIFPQHLPPRWAGFGSFSSEYDKHLTDTNVKNLFITKQNICQGKRRSHSSHRVLQLEDITHSLQYLQTPYSTMAAQHRLS